MVFFHRMKQDSRSTYEAELSPKFDEVAETAFTVVDNTQNGSTLRCTEQQFRSWTAFEKKE